MSSEVDRLVRFLHSSDPLEATRDGWSVVRVGRNRVWRVQSSSETLFVKITPDARYYDREYFGLEINRMLADQHDWIMAPRLLHADPDHHALVMEAMPGISVGRLLQSALRLDRNPFRRKAPVNRFLAALSSVVDWLQALHQVPVDDPTVLLDHTGAHMRARIHTKLRRSMDHGVLEIAADVLDRFKHVHVPRPSGDAHLICGDATLGNFFWDGHNVGRIDFEDLGFGSPSRDFSEIRQGLESIENKRWYWSTRPAIQLIPEEPNVVRNVLYRLEWAVDRHWADGRPLDARRAQELEVSIHSLLQELAG